MGILSWILVGLISGWLAGLVKRGGYGILGDIILGTIGALVGAFLAIALFGIGDALARFDIITTMAAFLGAIVTIAIVKALPCCSPV